MSYHNPFGDYFINDDLALEIDVDIAKLNKKIENLADQISSRAGFSHVERNRMTTPEINAKGRSNVSMLELEYWQMLLNLRTDLRDNAHQISRLREGDKE